MAGLVAPKESQILSDSMLTVEDIMAFFKISRANAYKLVNTDGFPSFRLNNQVRVDPVRLREWVHQLNGRSFYY